MQAAPTRREVVRRLPQLMAGLVAVGIGLAMMVEADLGLGPWEVLHQGISRRTGMPLGLTGILVGIPVFVLWWPLGQRPGVGTALNLVTIGGTIDVALAALPAPDELPARISLLLVAVLIVGVGAGLYLGTGLGAGPRDGLMTGLAAWGTACGWCGPPSRSACC